MTTYVGNWTVNTYITSSLSVSTDNLESASAYLANANYPYMMQNTGFAQKTLVLNVPRGVVYGTISLTFVNVGDPKSRDLYVYLNGQSISSSWDPYVTSGEGTYNTGSIDVTQQLIDQKSIQVTVEVTTWQGYWQVYGTLNTNTARLDPYADSSGQWTSEPTGWFSQSNNLLIPNI